MELCFFDLIYAVSVYPTYRNWNFEFGYGL